MTKGAGCKGGKKTAMLKNKKIPVGCHKEKESWERRRQMWGPRKVNQAFRGRPLYGDLRRTKLRFFKFSKKIQKKNFCLSDGEKGGKFTPWEQYQRA